MSSIPAGPPADADLPAKDPSGETQGKIDHITALQDGIDGLSLAMFEALRRLRDAVAPESGNLGAGQPSFPQDPGSQQQQHASATGEPDTDELWSLYRSGDADVVAKVHRATGGTPVQRREEFVRVHAKMEMEKDAELVAGLASSVLQKSAEIDRLVDTIPGMGRTRDEQMRIIEGLISLNLEALRDLDEAHRDAVARQASCRDFVRRHTCEALGIDEPDREES